ncbi:Abi family protein [Listeria monocytogenes]|nr:Abi family protein [Listeria monocytogenes]EAF2858374.1 Abi family protein [Listeria monocytogenes]EAF2957058.1 Abi family protein [Listeria monocytogenes]EAG7024719.1 Abi family protein [Listeria monocytogenes]
MKMKPFKTHNQQLKILRDRGLEVPPKSKRILEQVNYYNVVNGYKNPFLKKDSQGGIFVPEEYVKGAHFDEVYHLFSFDREFRQILLEYMLIFEMHFKSILAYKFSEKYPAPNAYLDINSYSNNPKKISKIVKLISTLSNEISRNVRRQEYSEKNSIEHYLDQHEGVPLWVLTNYLTIGSTSYFYDSLDDSLRDDLAKYFNTLYFREYKEKISLRADNIKNIMKTANHYRNVCAHGERLYAQHMIKRPRVEYLAKYLTGVNNERLSGNVFTMVALLKFVSKKKDYIEMIRCIDKLFIKYNGKIKSVSFESILKTMGFSAHWRKELL